MDPNGETDDRLIERARLGDRSAQQVLWHRHRRWVAAIILAHRPRTVEVEDLMQDVAIKFLSKLETLRDPSAFRPWLRQIAINICRGAARKLRPTLHLVGSDPDSDQPETGAVGAPASREESVPWQATKQEMAKNLLEQALSLPPDYREPLLLRCLRCMSYKQISELLQLPITTVETRLARARRMLREEFQSRYETEGIT